MPLGTCAVPKAVYPTLTCWSGRSFDVKLEKHRNDYYRLLLDVSTKGEWNSWLEFFLRGVRTQVAAAQKNVDRLVALGVLQEVTGKERNRIYFAPKIFDAAFEEVAPDSAEVEAPF